MKTLENVRFESFIRHGGQLFPIKDFNQSIVDTNYIEGAMRLTISGKELLSTSMWDYIDQLWAYVITGADRVKLGGEYSTHFPDQPIRLSLHPESGSRMRVRVEAREIIEASAPTKMFLTAVADGGDLFFSQLQRLLPHLTQAHLRYWEIAKRLR